MNKIICPTCRHVLGETDRSFDGKLKCPYCREWKDIKVIQAKTTDYFKFNIEEVKHD